MKNPKEIRKSFVWIIPFNIFIMTSGIWYIKYPFYEFIESLANLSSSIRIMPVDLVVVYMPIMFGVAFVVLLLGAIPCKESTLKIAERVGNTAVFIAIFLMFLCIFIIAPLQYYVMPKLGYTRCNILKGHPSIYFTDWVKNPDWCVRGKSREWVREQARLASTKDG